MAGARRLVRRRTLQLLVLRPAAPRGPCRSRVQRRMLGVPRGGPAAAGGGERHVDRAHLPAGIHRRGPDRHGGGGTAAAARRAGLFGGEPRRARADGAAYRPVATAVRTGVLDAQAFLVLLP